MKNSKLGKRVFIIHGWDGYPEEGWFPWLRKELENSGFNVQVPAMPNPGHPKIEEWVSCLSKLVGEVDENTYFVGHSIGCQTMIRFLETLPKDKKIGGAVFVAGWFTLMNLSSDEEWEIAKPWLETPIDFAKVRQHTKNFFAIFSDSDDWVSLENKEMFEKKLGTRTTVEHQKGHFSGSDGVTKLPSALKALLSFK